MDQAPKSKRRSLIGIKSLLKPFKQFTIKSKRSKKSTPLAGGSVENSQSVSDSLAEVASANSSTRILTVSLLYLPNEILEHVFFLLHPLEVVKCRLLSNHFKQIIDGSIELQLRIDLAIDGYLLGYRGLDRAKNVREFHEKRRKALESMKYITSWHEPLARGDLGHFEASNTAPYW
ncbi:2106_t:CDS:2, partial [Acaulospora colombiana]